MCMIKLIDYESEDMVLAVWNVKSIYDCKKEWLAGSTWILA